MHLPSATDLLNVWDAGAAASPLHRAMLLLQLAYPDAAPESLWQLSIGRRDALLLDLRRRIQGDALLTRAECARCHEPLELSFTISDILAESTFEPPQPSYEEVIAGTTIRFRLPSSADLQAVIDCEPEIARALLLQNCVLETENRQPLSSETAEALNERMTTLDPLANVLLDLNCPVCQFFWKARFDIVLCFWNELHHWALRLMHDIHRLATAYGWREADILALSPRRRQFYVDLMTER